MNCPCGTGKPLDACCGRFHAGEPAPTAEALMRSRYSAFATGNFDYLLATGPSESREELAEQAKATTWVGLTIEGVDAGSTKDTVGAVMFAARFLQDGKLAELRERSRFEREGGKLDGRWRYIDGYARIIPVNLGRNDPCPCGSGKKFKQCHAR